MGELIDFLFDHLHELICFPLLGGNGAYRHGFLIGILVTVALGWLWQAYCLHRARIFYFFATIPPSLRPSPSGFQSMAGCSRSGCILIIIVIGLLFMLVGSLYALIH